MGCVENITYEKFPKQSEFMTVGERVEVCYHYDTSKTHKGTIVRNDSEEPFETIIKLDNGRYLRGVECQFSKIPENTEKLIKSVGRTSADYIKNTNPTCIKSTIGIPYERSIGKCNQK